uniref:Uncharacterized protein n=1 Tax=Solanum lycopersicum TaxID=4081 RepID=A0A3Q7ERY6_SOLLC
MEVNPSPIMPPAFPRIMEVNPSPITPPAETQPSVPISVEHPNLAAFIQYGISNLPVSNNPAMIRQKYSSIIRHSSLKNASGVQRTVVIIIPRDQVLHFFGNQKTVEPRFCKIKTSGEYELPETELFWSTGLVFECRNL